MSDTLKLVLKGKWFDMIASGEKKEEYRDLKHYYWVRLRNHDGSFKHFDTVTFYLGYAKGRKEMVVKCEGTGTQTGNPEWGAIPGVIYYCIKLGDIIEKNF